MKEAALDVIHTIMKAFLFVFERGIIFFKIMKAVLLGKRSEAKKENSRHDEELYEAVFTLQSISD